MSGIIRILADRSKDSTGAGQFANLLPYSEFQSTDNRRPLRRSVLSKYDVLAICGQSLKKYTQPQLAMIREFVEAGGGLVLAASTPGFELEANHPIERMAQNAVAELFGAAFLSTDCRGARADASLQVGLPQDEVRVHKHAALGDAGAGLGLGTCGPISPPEGARILASHKATHQPVAAAFEFGAGRVVMVGAPRFANELGFTCCALARWLASGSKRQTDDDGVPEYIGARGGIKRGDYFHVTFDQSCADGLDETIALLQKANAALKRRFGEAWKPHRHLHLADAVSQGHHWHWPPAMGGQAPAASRARQLLLTLLGRGINRWGFYECLDAVFSGAPWRIQLMLELLEETGFGAEAARCRERADRWVAEMDQQAKVFDLARNYSATEESCARGLLLIRDFQATHGKETIDKLATTIPEKDAWKHLPNEYSWPSDRGVYYLSLAAGENLFPWFAEQRLTIHPLPLVQPDAEDVKAQMVTRLNQAVRDDTESLSSRMDAARDVCAMADEEEFSQDDWGTLCATLKLAQQGDKRADKALRKLSARSKPEEIRAIAALNLADLGDASVAEELIPLARQFEPRFQLAAGYALTKAGSERADELSLENLRDAQSNVVGNLAVDFAGHVMMHCKVAGYKASNIFSSTGLRLFTKDAAISVHSVNWVHTSPFWRRRGLSRCLMEATMNHSAARKCSCSDLGTGTRNVAHALYRSYGFVDMDSHEEWMCELPGNGPLRPPTDVSFREYREGDGPKIAALCREVQGRTLAFWGLPRGELDPSEFGYLAERKGDLIGLASAQYAGGDDTHIQHLIVREDEQRAEIADALIALMHQVVHKAGAKRIRWYIFPDEDWRDRALNRAGYEVKPTGGVWMMQIRNFVQFLQEISPVIEKRLADSDFKGWEGKIDLLGTRLRGRITVREGSVKASAPTSRPADIVMSCDDDTVTRVALGRETPFEAYLQVRLTIEPRVSDSITKLVETVFPKVPLA